MTREITDTEDYESMQALAEFADAVCEECGSPLALDGVCESCMDDDDYDDDDDFDEFDDDVDDFDDEGGEA
jgi:hypothetical protein